MGEQVLTLAVLSILITAPLGAIGILGLGPKLLSCDLPAAGQEQDLEQNQDQTIDPNSEEIIDLQREQDKFLESEFRIEEKVKDNDITGEKMVNQHDLQVEMGIIFFVCFLKTIILSFRSTIVRFFLNDTVFLENFVRLKK